MRRKVCFVIQRYGLEVNGGAELHCRQLVEHLKPYCDVEVLTTKAIDYMTWKDEYEASEEMINGVKVRRFPVEKERDINVFNVINSRFFEGKLQPEEEDEWMEKQGPYVPELIHYIAAHKNDYDVFVFFTYLYYPTVYGVRLVKDKAIVIPTAHDEPFLKMHVFDPVFTKPKALFLNTEDERLLIRKKYKNWHIKHRIAGVGVELPEDVSAARFKEKYQLDHYMVYVGRIDLGKNCDQLFRDFAEYKKRYPDGLKLVLMGKPVIELPEDPDIISLGFVSDEDKFDGIAGAEFLVLPSKFESLSMVVLEAFSLKIPVLVNGECEVLKTHCIHSNGGFYYTNTDEFCEMANYLDQHEELRKEMGIGGQKYVQQNYQWDVIVNKLVNLIEYVIESNKDEEK